MRIAILASEFPPGPGGIGTQAEAVASQLHARNWDVHVLTAQDYAAEDEIAAFNKGLAFPVTRVLARSSFVRIGVIARAMRRIAPDLILSTGDRAAYAAVAAGRVSRIPVAVIEHGRAPAAIESLVKRWAFRSADSVIAVSRFSLARLEGLTGRLAHATVIHNGADERRFRPVAHAETVAFRKRLGLEDARLITTVGSVTDRKGQDVMIRALPRVLSTVRNAHYLMVGRPVERTRLLALAKSLGVSERVRFLDAIDNTQLPTCLTASDVFVMTSRHTPTEFEGFGIAVLEAALCAVPSVVSDQSGLAEAVVDMETGFVVPLEDHERTADAVLRLLTSVAERSRLAGNARRRALEGFTWKACAARYDSHLRSLLERKFVFEDLGNRNAS